MIDEESLEIAKQVLRDATKDDLPASTQVFLRMWSPDLIETLEALLKIARAAQDVYNKKFQIHAPSSRERLGIALRALEPGTGDSKCNHVSYGYKECPLGCDMLDGEEGK